MRENNQYGNGRFFIGIDIALVAMVVYSFDAEYYDIKEVGCYDEATCKALAKHDSSHVKKYEFSDTDPDNSWKVYAEANIKYKKTVYNRSFLR